MAINRRLFDYLYSKTHAIYPNLYRRAPTFFNLLSIIMFLQLYIAPKSLASEQQMPVWVSTAKQPDDKKYSYTVGVATRVDKIEFGMEQSWANGLENFARTRFPQLQSLSQVSKETLNGSTYERITALKLDAINWEGVTEATELGSPYVREHIRTDGKSEYTVYRLIRWDLKSLRAEINRLSTTKKQESIRTTKKSNAGTGKLTVFTVPDNAHVLVNNELVGKSNLDLTGLAQGQLRVLIQKDGFEPHEETVELKEHSNHVMRTELKRKTGTLNINSKPEGALVFLDKLPVGRTPLSIQKELGEYKIDLQLDGYQNQSKEVNHSLQITEILETLIPKPGKLTIVAHPFKAEVELNDEKIGISPILSRTVPGGIHRLKVSSDGFQTQELVINISSSRENTITLKLNTIDEESAIEKAHKSKLELKRFLASQVFLGNERINFIFNMCERKQFDFCFELLSIFVGPNGDFDNRFFKKAWHHAWVDWCENSFRNVKCAEEIAALSIIPLTKTFTERIFYDNKKELLKNRIKIEDLPDYKKLRQRHAELNYSCTNLNKKQTTDWFCEYIKDNDHIKFISKVQIHCLEIKNASGCAVFADLLGKHFLGNIERHYEKHIENKFRQSLSEIEEQSCKNINVMSFPEQGSFPEKCIDRLPNDRRPVFLKEMCLERKNSDACSRLIDSISTGDVSESVGKEFRENIIPKIAEILRTRCEYGVDKNQCKFDREKHQLSELDEQFLTKSECERGSPFACVQINRNKEAFEFSTRECIKDFRDNLENNKSGKYFKQECNLAYNLFVNKFSKMPHDRMTDFMTAACHGGVSEACIVNGKIPLDKLASVRLNCGIDSLSDASKTTATVDVYNFWSTIPESKKYCVNLASSIKSNDKTSMLIKKSLIKNGCLNYKILDMCYIYGSKNHLKEAILVSCRKKDWNYNQCKFILDRVSVQQREFYCTEKKLPSACHSLGMQYEKSKETLKAANAYRELCHIVDSFSCGVAGYYFYANKKWGDAIKLLAIGCEKENPNYCLYLGHVHRELGLRSDAYKSYLRACEHAKNGNSCEFAGLASVERELSHQLLQRARDIYEKDCKNGDNGSCESLKEVSKLLWELGSDK